MRDELLGYYERELSFVRQMGAEFARKYPKIAARLSLEADKCEDPHVERMIEAFAFLAGRLRLRWMTNSPKSLSRFSTFCIRTTWRPSPRCRSCSSRWILNVES